MTKIKTVKGNSLEILSENTKHSLEVLAGVDEIHESLGSRKGIEFNFKNSLKCNYCKIVEYKIQSTNEMRYIIQLRKKGTDYLNNEFDKLVFEDIVKFQDIEQVFENKTGIYLSALDY